MLNKNVLINQKPSAAGLPEEDDEFTDFLSALIEGIVTFTTNLIPTKFVVMKLWWRGDAYKIFMKS